MNKPGKLSAAAGFTIIEIVVGVAIFAILAGVIIANVNPTIKQATEVERISVVADGLDELARAIAFFEPTKAPTSFIQTVGRYPGRLSQLTTQISVSQKNSCGTLFTSGQVTGWTGTYYNREIPLTGLKVADGFVTQDSLIRTPATDVSQARGALSIVIPDVTRSDAAALALIVDGDSLGTNGAVRYVASGTNPVTVSYRMEIGGC